MRDHSQRVRVDLSQLHIHPGAGGWAGGPLCSSSPGGPQQSQPHGAVPFGAHNRPRPASGAGDWCPSLEQNLSPQRHFTAPSSSRGSTGRSTDPFAPPRLSATIRCPRTTLAAMMRGWSSAKFWFDPLYVEDPLRQSNNVGRNCFRIYAIQQEFVKAHQLCTRHPGEYHEDGDYPILSRLCKALP